MFAARRRGVAVMGRSGGGRTGSGGAGSWMPNAGSGGHPLYGIDDGGGGKSSRQQRRAAAAERRRKARKARKSATIE